MTGNAGPILLITNKGRTIRKLIKGGGGGIHTTAKKDSYKEFDNEKKMIMLFLFFGENTVSKP